MTAEVMSEEAVDEKDAAEAEADEKGGKNQHEVE